MGTKRSKKAAKIENVADIIEASPHQWGQFIDEIRPKRIREEILSARTSSSLGCDVRDLIRTADALLMHCDDDAGLEIMASVVDQMIREARSA